jgi:hypothetical protein
VSSSESEALAHRVRQAIDPVNLAGLCEPGKRNWYSVDAADAIAGAPKLGVAATDIAAALTALGLGP